MGKEQTKRDLRHVSTLAFVMPVFDVDSGEKDGDDWRYIPCEHFHNQGYWVFTWNFKKQRWEYHDGPFEYDDAREVAWNEHVRLSKALGCKL